MSPGEALQTEIPEARRMENYRSGNCLLSYFDPNTKKFRNFTASQFGDVWNHFDQDGQFFLYYFNKVICFELVMNVIR
ncbi:unnamed protein product [Schistosoma mattheei]|uniref:Uncharacterized protein n=1 Tax=Schistosoma mattheei TaxID=31246 RepID=A0A183PT11_9TREM|nr:unnamed protein product [Schistosoma mattheei]